MARLRYNGLSATLGASLTSSATAVTFGAALTHSNGTNVPTIAGSDYVPLAILDASGHISEIVWLTAGTAPITSGTIARAKEGTTGVAHSSGDKVAQSVLVSDVTDRRQVLVYSGGAYPTRPTGGICEYVGPTQPTDWVAHDTWIKAAP